jgi:GAF domain-containing protein
MLLACIPANEPERLAALRELHILDTRPEERFDMLVECAARMFEVPIALITLIDEHRQWFKARVGMKIDETARDVSFCGHAIHGSDILVVEDASQDPRFADNPFVTGEPGIRFYAGAPLVSPRGHFVGTLCIADSKPRHLEAAQLQLLDALRNLASSELWVTEASAALQLFMPRRTGHWLLSRCDSSRD